MIVDNESLEDEKNLIFCHRTMEVKLSFPTNLHPKLVSTSIVGTDIRMSNLDIRLSNLDIRMSSLDIRMSKLILEFGKNKTAKNSEILVAFRIFFHFFNTPYG